eukprot:SAG31_NODE_919_length_11010_cov_27.449821_2_plen_203_part_00
MYAPSNPGADRGSVCHPAGCTARRRAPQGARAALPLRSAGLQEAFLRRERNKTVSLQRRRPAARRRLSRARLLPPLIRRAAVHSWPRLSSSSYLWPRCWSLSSRSPCPARRSWSRGVRSVTLSVLWDFFSFSWDYSRKTGDCSRKCHPCRGVARRRRTHAGGAYCDGGGRSPLLRVTLLAETLTPSLPRPPLAARSSAAWSF